MRIYFDNCCLNRPFDDLKDNATRMECEAVLSIIDICESGIGNYTEERGTSSDENSVDIIAERIRKRNSNQK